MKIIFFLSALFCIILSTSCFSQGIGQKRISVASTDFSTLTNVRVTCSEFENSFTGRIKVKEIDNMDTIQRLDFFLEKLRYVKRNEDIDARAKFVYEKGNGEKVKICISKFDIVVDGRLIKTNENFLGFLRSLIL